MPSRRWPCSSCAIWSLAGGLSGRYRHFGTVDRRFWLALSALGRRRFWRRHDLELLLQRPLGVRSASGEEPSRRIFVVWPDRDSRIGINHVFLDAHRRPPTPLSPIQARHGRDHSGLEFCRPETTAVLRPQNLSRRSRKRLRYEFARCKAIRLDHRRRTGRTDRGLRIAHPDRHRADRAGKEHVHGRHLAHGQLQGQPHRYRRTSLLFQVRPRDAVVARVHADRRRRPRMREHHLSAVARGGSSPQPAGADADRVHAGPQPQDRGSISCAVLRLSDHAQHDTVLKLGLWRTAGSASAICCSVCRPIKPEKNLEEFFINRFGRELYRTFFKSYTEKCGAFPATRSVPSGVPSGSRGCRSSSRSSTSLSKLLSAAGRARPGAEVTETSLIEQFLYPKLGPGQMWEAVADEVLRSGGQIITGCRRAAAATSTADRVDARRDQRRGHRRTRRCISGDYFFSTMPVKDLIALARRRRARQRPGSRRRAALSRLHHRRPAGRSSCWSRRDSPQGKKLIDDNWIYIQEPDVLVGRLQIFNNWSPEMVADPSKVWIGHGIFLLRDRRALEDSRTKR